MTRTRSTPAPVSARERIVLIDVVRGVALCGILLGNLVVFSGDVYRTPEQQAALGSQHASDAVRLAVNLLIDNKFVGLFALLFGLGFGLQLERMERAGVGAWGSYYRRMAMLGVFGVVHAALLWWGDVLRFFALWGCLLPLFRRCSTRGLAVWGIVIGVIGPAAWRSAALLAPEAGVFDRDIDTSVLSAFAEGSYRDVVRWNWAFDRQVSGSLTQPAYQLAVLGRMVLGMWAGRWLVARPTASDGVHLGAAAITFGFVGAAGGALWLGLRPHEAEIPPGWIAAATLPIEASFLALTGCYAAGLATLWRRPAARRCLVLFAPAGRMALTNYALQTGVAVWLYYGFAGGPALMNRAPLTGIVPIWLAVCAVQLTLSRVWLRLMLFGPCEWLWRSVTYRRLQPLFVRGNSP